MHFETLHSGRYTHKQCGTQRTWAWFLSLTVAGCVRSKVRLPDGRTIESTGEQCLSLLPPECFIEFEYTRERENYVVIGSSPSLDFGPEGIFLDLGNTRLKLDPRVPLGPEDTIRFRGTFEKIIALRNNPLPANIFMAEQLCLMLLGELALKSGGGAAGSGRKNFTRGEIAAAELKQMLDEDERFSCTLEEHCRALGYTPTHARRLFSGCFGIDPQEYRLRRRLERILMLLGSEQYSAKEIADMVGMKNVTHLHTFIRSRCGCTPGELRRRMNL